MKKWKTTYDCAESLKKNKLYATYSLTREASPKYWATIKAKDAKWYYQVGLRGSASIWTSSESWKSVATAKKKSWEYVERLNGNYWEKIYGEIHNIKL